MTWKCSQAHRLSRRQAAEFIGESETYIDNLARKKNKRRHELPYHMRGNKSYYYVADLIEFEKGKQTF